MAIFIEIIEGPDRVGEVLKVRSGFRIGRTSGDLILNDSKVSSQHCVVERGEGGQYVLVDQKSSNGIKINGQKVPRIALLPGIRFQVGKTHCKVVEKAEPSAGASGPVGTAPSEPDELTPPPVLRWQNRISSIDISNKNQVVKSVSPTEGFSSLTTVCILTGIDRGKSWQLGWGPRLLNSPELGSDLRDQAWDKFDVVISESGHQAELKLYHRGKSKDPEFATYPISEAPSRIEIENMTLEAYTVSRPEINPGEKGSPQ